MTRPPLPTRCCIVTNIMPDKPPHFMLSVDRGVALMKSPVGTTLDLIAGDQMHAYADTCVAAEITALQSRIEVLEDALRYAVKQVPELATVPGISAALEKK